jgi:hypothetical protein
MFHRLTYPPAPRRGPAAFSVVVLAAVVAASLAGCGGDPEPTPTPTPSATATPTPTPTPTPSPTVPVPAEYDPDWTQDQLEVVKLVEAFDSLDNAMRKDPQNWDDWTKMPAIADGALLSGWREAMRIFQDTGMRWSEDVEVIRVKWWVDPARDVDGRQEINLSWCRQATGGSIIHADGQVTKANLEPARSYGTAQLIPNAGWRLIDTEGGTEPC